MGLFEVGEGTYTLKFNQQKVNQIERMLNISFVNEMVNKNGMLSMTMLEALFAVGLYDTKDEKAIKGKKAQDVFNAVIRDIGYQGVIEVVLGKVDEDLGFLFR